MPTPSLEAYRQTSSPRYRGRRFYQRSGKPDFAYILLLVGSRGGWTSLNMLSVWKFLWLQSLTLTVKCRSQVQSFEQRFEIWTSLTLSQYVEYLVLVHVVKVHIMYLSKTNAVVGLRCWKMAGWIRFVGCSSLDKWAACSLEGCRNSLLSFSIVSLCYFPIWQNGEGTYAWDMIVKASPGS